MPLPITVGAVCICASPSRAPGATAPGDRCLRPRPYRRSPPGFRSPLVLGRALAPLAAVAFLELVQRLVRLAFALVAVRAIAVVMLRRLRNRLKRAVRVIARRISARRR